MPAILMTVLVSMVSASIAIVPQERTDFSGRWTTVLESGTVSGQGRAGGAPGQAAPAPGRGRGPARGDMGSGWGPTITITQDAKQLVVEYSVFARGDMQPPFKFTYALDGNESRNTVMMGRGMETHASRAAWDGAKLRITSQHQMMNPETGKPLMVQTVQTLSLESPTELVVETVRAGVLGGEDTTTRTIYRKM